jgi:hypothetical protein
MSPMRRARLDYILLRYEIPQIEDRLFSCFASCRSVDRTNAGATGDGLTPSSGFSSRFWWSVQLRADSVNS